MFNKLTKTFIIVAAAIMALQVCTATAGYNDDGDYVNIKTRKLNGPRIGLTFVPDVKYLRRNGDLVNGLKESDIGVIISQFGWHFEWLVTPEGGGPSFVTQLVPFLGGVEYATVIPTLTLVCGIRMPKGFEFGLGPNVLFNFKELKNDDDGSGNPVNTALILAVGKSIDFSGVSIPLNLAVALNNGGTRISFVFGYAMGGRRS